MTEQSDSLHHSSLANLQGEIATTNNSVRVYENSNTTSHVYGTLSKGTKVSIIEKSSGWYKIHYSETWRNAKRFDVEEYLNPNNHDIFQHLLLSSSTGVSAKELNKVLIGKGILEGKGQDFINASNKHSVNEVYLIAHALLETGHGTSGLANGIEVGKDKNGNAVVVTGKNRNSLSDVRKVYNMFGIGAYDSCPETCGATYAYNSKWFTPADAITGGAQFVSSSYFARGQNTLYKMRWNYAYPNDQGGFPQYATDVGWAVKQIYQIKNLYSKLNNPTMLYDIPRYK
ncbi:N-acetylglucosaminidase [Siminovitchia fortis]|uniref:N-acetylglucosaminidase n=1 Tax=Siminovitchia fortis TaxID=254758 RepID=UPI001642675E|nr:N-acetylglucosaminidase [Siminovitchia fortis]